MHDSQGLEEFLPRRREAVIEVVRGYPHCITTWIMLILDNIDGKPAQRTLFSA